MFDVQVCPGLLGKDALQGLIRVHTYSRDIMIKLRWRTPLLHRHGLGVYTGPWGARAVQSMPWYALGVADFRVVGMWVVGLQSACQPKGLFVH